MGAYYKWLCDDLKECFDPSEILGPKFDCSGKGYGIKAHAIPHSAWAIGFLATGRWLGHAIRLVGDYDDDYDCPGYEEVSWHILREGLENAPAEALRFLCEQIGEPSPAPNDHEAEEAERVKNAKILLLLTADKWTRRCNELDCARFGERHAGDHEILPSTPGKAGGGYRQYALGLDRIEAEPGQSVRLRIPLKQPFDVTRLVFAEETVKAFSMLELRVNGESLLISGCPVLEMLPIGGTLRLQDGDVVEVVARNASDRKATFVCALTGWAKTDNAGGINGA
jgi:hypothetical protein